MVPKRDMLPLVMTRDSRVVSALPSPKKHLHRCFLSLPPPLAQYALIVRKPSTKIPWWEHSCERSSHHPIDFARLSGQAVPLRSVSPAVLIPQALSGRKRYCLDSTRHHTGSGEAFGKTTQSA